MSEQNNPENEPVYVELGDYQTLPGVDVPPVPQRPFSTLSAKSHSRGNDRIFPPIGNLSEPTRPLPPPPSQPKQTKSTEDTGTGSKVPAGGVKLPYSIRPQSAGNPKRWNQGNSRSASERRHTVHHSSPGPFHVPGPPPSPVRHASGPPPSPVRHTSGPLPLVEELAPAPYPVPASRIIPSAPIYGRYDPPIAQQEHPLPYNFPTQPNHSATHSVQPSSDVSYGILPCDATSHMMAPPNTLAHGAHAPTYTRQLPPVAPRAGSSIGGQSRRRNSMPVSASSRHRSLSETGDQPVEDLWNIFKTLSTDDRITVEQLQSGLINHDNIRFNSDICRKVIAKFQRNQCDTIGPYEFPPMWEYIQAHISVFNQLKTERCPTIGAVQLLEAFEVYGYTLSLDFCRLCVTSCSRSQDYGLMLDEFVECMLVVQTVLEYFNMKVHSNQGHIDISYEDFMELAFR